MAASRLRYVLCFCLVAAAFERRSVPIEKLIKSVLLTTPTGIHGCLAGFSYGSPEITSLIHDFALRRRQLLPCLLPNNSSTLLARAKNIYTFAVGPSMRVVPRGYLYPRSSLSTLLLQLRTVARKNDFRACRSFPRRFRNPGFVKRFINSLFSSKYFVARYGPKRPHLSLRRRSSANDLPRRIELSPQQPLNCCRAEIFTRFPTHRPNEMRRTPLSASVTFFRVPGRSKSRHVLVQQVAHRTLPYVLSILSDTPISIAGSRWGGREGPSCGKERLACNYQQTSVFSSMIARLMFTA